MNWSKMNNVLLEIMYRVLIGVAILLVILISVKVFIPIIILSILFFLIGVINYKIRDDIIIKVKYKEKEYNE